MTTPETGENNNGPNNGIPICDTESFQALPALAQLYFFATLDILVDLAHGVSHGFMADQHLYSGLDPSDTNLFGKFCIQYSTLPELLGPQQRRNIFGGLFGTPGGTAVDGCGSFTALRDSLLQACIRYTANIRETDNKTPLKAGLKIPLRIIHEYLQGVQGAPAEWSRDRLTEVTGAAYEILQNPTVATVFGVSTAPEKPWPIKKDQNGNILIEQVTGTEITRLQFGLLQQVALTGAMAIRDVIECEAQVTESLVSNCISWNTALVGLRNCYSETQSY